MDATPKAEPIDNLLSFLTGKKRSQTIADNMCMLCVTQDAASSLDEDSAEEYLISGMCGVCQDSTFK